MAVSEIEGIEEIFEQTSIRVNERVKLGKRGWDISPNLEHTHVPHPAKPPKPPEPPAIESTSPPIAFSTTVATSYTELMSAIQAQVGALGLKLTDFDDLAGFPAGLSGKVFGLLQVKRLGPEKMFDALCAAGLRLRVEVDPDQEARMRIRIAENYLPRQANQARNGHASTLPSSAVLHRVMQPWRKVGGKKRWADKSKKERSAHMKMMVMAREKKRRMKAAHGRRIKQRQREARNVIVAVVPV